MRLDHDARRYGAVLGLVLFNLAVPLTGWAQQAAGIAGIVRDASGGVLPGVVVEASSPALIEKVRTATTDAAGSAVTASRPESLPDATRPQSTDSAA